MELNLTAKKSPRIENGKIYWYEGDTFSIEWTITLTDETTHEEIDLSPLDTVLFKFSNTYKNLVHECECEVGENGKVILEIPKEVSEKFAVGRSEEHTFQSRLVISYAVFCLVAHHHTHIAR